jgi:hypothetical protein
VWVITVLGADARIQPQQPAEVVGIAPGLLDDPIGDAEGERRGEDLTDPGGRYAEEAALPPESALAPGNGGCLR